MNRITTTIALLFTITATVQGQSDSLLPHILKDSPPKGTPMTHEMLDVLATARANKLDLVEEQQVALDDLFTEYRNRLRDNFAEFDAKFAGRTEVSGDELSAAHDEDAMERAALIRHEYTERAKKILLPFQVETASNQVLIGRLKRFGLAGLLSSEELHSVGLKQGASEILTQIQQKRDAAKGEIDVLLDEFREIQAEYKKKILAIQRRQLNAALNALGEDGLKLRDLLDRLEQDEYSLP